MDLQLTLSLPTTPIKPFASDHFQLCFSHKTCTNPNDTKKRSFHRAFGHHNYASTLHSDLFLSTNPPNEEDDGDQDDCSSVLTSINVNGGDGNLVGWPPIKTWRRNQFLQHNPNLRINGSSNSLFVKVEMEGVGIARKIDLTRFHSFQPLTIALLTMFGHEEESTAYALTFRDREGDWLLASDLPWRTFTRSVRRLKLQRIRN